MSRCVFIETSPNAAAGAGGNANKKSVLSTDETPLDATLVAVEEEKWNKFTVKDLKPFLSERGLPVSGTKKELVTRLVTYEVRQSVASAVSAVSVADKEAMDVDNDGDDQQVTILDTLTNQHHIPADTETAETTAVSSGVAPPLKDRSQYMKSLSELTSSAAAFASAAVANTSTTTSITTGVSKRSFRLNLDELTEELENRPVKPLGVLPSEEPLES